MKKMVTFILILLYSGEAIAAGTGTLQIHFMDVGQADGILVISPGGETVLFDGGRPGLCDKPLAYMDQIGIKEIDYAVTSHYHSDHYGCDKEIYNHFPLIHDAYDRGGSVKGTEYANYIQAVGNHRKTAMAGTAITLDAKSKDPVVIKVVATNGNGIQTTNENDLSVACLLSYDNFQTVLAGDLSGFDKNGYKDIETTVTPKVGQVEVYKVNHHGSQYSSNELWLRTLKPKVGIISVGILETGDSNSYKHPRQECLDRLHSANISTYWTERGNGAIAQPGQDIVGGNIVIEVRPRATSFTVSYNNGSKKDVFDMWEKSTISTPRTSTTGQNYAWSKNSKTYHYSTCKYVDSISKQNLVEGDVPPAGKTLHVGCPK